MARLAAARSESTDRDARGVAERDRPPERERRPGSAPGDRDRAERGERAGKAEKVGRGAAVDPQVALRRREALGVVLMALGLFLLLSVASLALGDGKLMGPVGLWTSTVVYSACGVGALLCVALLIALALRCLRALPLRVRPVRLLGVVGGALSFAVLIHLFLGNYRLHSMPPGGALGEYGAEMTKALVGTAGTALLSISGLLLSLLATTSLSFQDASSVAARLWRAALDGVRGALRALFPGQGDEEPAVQPALAAVAQDSDVAARRLRRSREAQPEGVPALSAEQLTPAVLAAVDGEEGRRSPLIREAGRLVSRDGEAPVAKEPARAPEAQRATPAAPLAPVIANRGAEAAPAMGIARAAQAPASPVPPLALDADEPEDDDDELPPEPTIMPRQRTGPRPVVAAVPPPEVTEETAAPPMEPVLGIRERARKRKPEGRPAVVAPVVIATEEAGQGGPTLVDNRAAGALASEIPAVEPAAAPRPVAPRPVERPAAPERASVTPPVALDREGRIGPAVLDREGRIGPAVVEDSEEEDAEPVVVPPPPARPARAVNAAARSARPAAAERGREGRDYLKLGSEEFKLPPIDMLDYHEQGQCELDRVAMLELAQRLEKTLADYLVKGRVSEIHPGPVVTMFEFVPAPGTKISKITALSNDLAMALEAMKVRIVAPIPGKAAVGIEVPNRTRETVYLKEVLADDCYTKAKSKLTMALGKDIAGLPVCVDLAKMPHLLVAGTTGSGKSVSVNGMISSILFNATPDEVKMIMIDPKMLELSIYEGIPHLLLPVVTDPKKANLALRWAVDEMERRYELISKAGVRDIGSYNKKVEKILEDGGVQAPLMPRFITINAVGPDGIARNVQVYPSEEAVEEVGGEVTEEILDEISAVMADFAAQKELVSKEPPRKLPYIVVLIDEFADLMMVASKEVETSVARIAQKARAAGIHLILATQRPSVDVITGLIKANFPSRIAFQVASRIDSRTILDAQGAENLLGMGDMLFTDRGQALRRIHGALITDSEIHKLVENLKKQGQPIYDMDILKPRSDEDGEPEEEEVNDEMYEQAVRLVLETRQASISMIQRRLRIGYNRAARMIERMERDGMVSAADGAKGREVLVPTGG